MESSWDSSGYFRDKKAKIPTVILLWFLRFAITAQMMEYQKAKIHVCSGKKHVCKILPNIQIQLNSRW